MHNLPLCFICAKAEEYLEIKRQLQARHDEQKDVHIEYTDLFYEEKNFTVGTIKAKQRTVRFFLTHGADQGPESFGIFSSRIFSLLNPQASVLLGTCAARKGIQYRLGDVAFGYSAFNYEEGKYMDEKTFNPDLLRRISNFARTQIGGFLTDTPKQYHDAIFLTGSAVRQDAQMIFNKWMEPRKADVLDMEASAFFNSCQQCHVAALGVVKGVSDNGDEDKTDLMHRTALSNAAMAALGLCKHYFNDSNFPQSSLESSGALLAKSYFKNFLQKAVTGILGTVKKVDYLDIKDKYEKKLYLVDPGVDGLTRLTVGAVTHHVKKCNLEHIAVGVNELRPFTLYYKKGKIFDYPTTLNGLVNHPEKAINYEQFKSTLEQLWKEEGMEEDVGFISINELEKKIEEA